VHALLFGLLAWHTLRLPEAPSVPPLRVIELQRSVEASDERLAAEVTVTAPADGPTVPSTQQVELPRDANPAMPPEPVAPQSEPPAAPDGQRGRNHLSEALLVDFFGAAAVEGSRFVFVIDRSSSMETNRALELAKTELVRCLDTLPRTTQFQIVFYNTEAKLLNLGGTQLRPASEYYVRKAREQITQIAAQGGTNHVSALALALKLRPDVLFLLTDAERFDEKPIHELTRTKVGGRHMLRTAIHIIQFTHGSPHAPEPSIERLATANGGLYRLIDTTAIGGKR
jgi:hypothetical protein